MPSQPRNMSEQEHSIKVRSNELYVEEAPASPASATKPFPIYLRETAAQPLSTGIKAIFWAIGLIVAILFLAALWRVAHRHGLKRPAAKAGVETVGLPGDGRGRGELAYLSREASPATIRYPRTP